MTKDVTSRILQLFEVRVGNDPEVSPATVEALLSEQRDADFGADDEILDELLNQLEEDK